MKYFSKELTRKEIMSRVGNMRQMAGAQRMICDEGRGKGTSVIRVRNGGGIDFSVIPDRGMDILDVQYRGVPLAWISKSGLVHPAYTDDRGFGWLRSFGGGMLATCGLRNVGGPVDEEGEHFGLHGRISSLPAKNVNTLEEWVGDDYIVEVSGKVTEASTFGENLVLNRTMTVNSNKNEILLHDRIRNEGFRPEPLMLLYHMNWGSPLLAADSRLLMDIQSTSVRDANASTGSWNDFTDPVHGIDEVVYLHKFIASDDHIFSYELRNDALGIGIRVSWDQRELPFLTQWKMLGEGEYVLGLEPGNCYPGGRTAELKENRGEILQSFEEKEVSIRIEFLDV